MTEKHVWIYHCLMLFDTNWSFHLSYLVLPNDGFMSSSSTRGVLFGTFPLKISVVSRRAFYCRKSVLLLEHGWHFVFYPSQTKYLYRQSQNLKLWVGTCHIPVTLWLNHTAFNRRVVGSSATSGVLFWLHKTSILLTTTVHDRKWVLLPVHGRHFFVLALTKKYHIKPFQMTIRIYAWPHPGYQCFCK